MLRDAIAAHSMAVALILIVTSGTAACGRASSGDSIVSGTSAVSPSSSSQGPPSSSNNPNSFLPGDCTYPQSGTGTPSPKLTFLSLTFMIPPGWRNLGRPPNQYEIGLLRLQAPASYAYAPTYIDVQGSLGRWPNATASWVVRNAIPGPADPGSVQVNSCSVAGESAAYYSYVKDTEAGYFVLWMRGPNALEITLHGNGGVDSQAIHDAKALLGSVMYTASTP